MKAETPNVKYDRDPKRIAQLEGMANAITRAGISTLFEEARKQENGASVSTCAVALTAGLANCMATFDRDAAAEVFELMGAAIRSGETPRGAERQRMFKVQQQLFHGELALMAKAESRGSA